MAMAADRQDDTLEYVRHRLIAWADWLSSGGVSSVRGYSSRACHLAGQPVADGCDLNHDEAWEIERICVDIRKKRPLWFLVIEAIYIRRANTRLESTRIGIGDTSFKRIRVQVESYIAGRLDG